MQKEFKVNCTIDKSISQGTIKKSISLNSISIIAFFFVNFSFSVQNNGKGNEVYDIKK